MNKKKKYVEFPSIDISGDFSGPNLIVAAVGVHNHFGDGDDKCMMRYCIIFTLLNVNLAIGWMRYNIKYL